jgi:hypothetical protein
MHRRILSAAVGIALAFAFLPSSGAVARSTAATRSDTREVSSQVRKGTLPIDRGSVSSADRSAAQSSGGANQPRVGQHKLFLALDDFNQELYVKDYTLRGQGDHIEVWVASDSDEVSTNTDFPEGDCRNGPRTQITDTQVNYLVGEFDRNMYPIESSIYSVPPDRNGSRAPLAKILGLPANYYRGDGDNIVTLVDNVRDDQFYDTNNAHNFTYIAGFFSTGFNDLLNRNVMTIDAYDWIHRTTANPPNNPVPGDNCASAPARPFLYEGVFAHEYQHLLESYEDPGESSWANEGMSDMAIDFTNYGDPSVPITDIHFDSHIQCFLGYLGVLTPANPNPREGGPENSLTLWGDQTDHESEILCDYGAAYSFMEWLQSHYGTPFISALHREDLHGLEGLQAVLDDRAAGTTTTQVIDRWAAAMLLDGVLDDGSSLRGGNPVDYQVTALDAIVNLGIADAYSTPGAPPNGSDYVQPRTAGGVPIPPGSITSIGFDGVNELPPLPLAWVVDPAEGNPPPSLFAGNDDNLDNSIVREVAVPAGTPSLTFDAQYLLEDGFDYGYVQVSTDGGESYETIPCSNQEEGPLGSAFNGDSGGFVAETCSLEAYAGDTIVVAFREVTDASVHEGGLWIDNVKVDSTVLSDGSTLSGWQSRTEYNPIDVEGYTVRVIAFNDEHTHASIGQITLNGDFDGTLSGRRLRQVVPANADVAAVIVTYHDTTEQVQQYAPYTLTVNGVTQPGG